MLYIGEEVTKQETAEAVSCLAVFNLRHLLHLAQSSQLARGQSTPTSNLNLL
jgi:hypothetical protein